MFVDTAKLKLFSAFTYLAEKVFLVSQSFYKKSNSKT